MAVIALTLPLARFSPIHVPRRDLAADASEGLTLQVTVIASDTPNAAPVSLAASGTNAVLQVWGALGWWDYGRMVPPVRSAAHTAEATIVDAAAGRFDIVLAPGIGDAWPQRLGWTLRLGIGNAAPSALSWGALQWQRIEAEIA